MLQHVLGVGSIGSLIAVHLARNTPHTVRLIVRDRNFLQHSLRPSSSPSSSESFACKPIAYERDGVQSWTPPGRIEAVQAELLQYAQPQGMSGHPQASTYKYDQALKAGSQMQSFADISTLWITTKAQQVIPAIQSLLPRLSSDSTLVLLQNGAGLLEQMIRDLFPDQDKRPSFVLCVNTHGAYVKDWGKKSTSKGLITEWAGVGDIAFGILPNIHIQRHVEERHPESPLLNPLSSIPPPLSNLSFPSSSLQTTISSLLACTELNPRFLSLSSLQVLQKQKVAVNAVINSLTSIYDIKNGHLLSHNQHITPTMFNMCQEASSVFAAQLRRELHEYSQKPSRGGEELSTEQKEILETGRLHEGHPLHAVSLYNKTIQVARSTGQNISSTLQDIRSGKPQTEIDYMNGYISSLGREYGIPTPINDTLANMVKYKVSLNKLAAVISSTPRRPSISTSDEESGSEVVPKVRHYKPMGKGDPERRKVKMQERNYERYKARKADDAVHRRNRQAKL